MGNRVKVGANDPCPCGSLLKYKKCCRGKVDWPNLLTKPTSSVVPYLSVRGRNLLFLSMIADALQLDSFHARGEWNDLKRAFTPDAVRRIFQSVDLVWPTDTDLADVLAREQRGTSGLYVGLYEPELIVKGITRHSLYADRILLVDPFMSPSNVRPQYNPVLHPEMHRTNAMRWAMLWLLLMPWIDAGIVEFIKTPGDLDTALEFQAMEVTKQRYAKHPELQPRREETEPLFKLQEQRFKQDFMLGMPDDYIRRTYREFKPEASADDVERLVAYIQRQRDADPFFVDTIDKKPKGELIQVTSGASYEMAKLTAMLTGSFIMTDIPSRWREIQLDRAEAKVDPERWSPFAKAFQGLPFKYLNAVPLPAALELRHHGRLERMRGFLRRVWHSSAEGDEFADANVPQLAAELQHEVGEADAEWKAIDRELLQWFGTELVGGLLAAGPAIALGGAEWVGFGLAAGGLTNLVVSTMKRTAHLTRYPAGFFAKLESGAFE